MTDLKAPQRGSYDYLLRPRLEPEVRGPSRPPRVTVNIEIIQCAPKPRPRRLSRLWWLVPLALLIGAVS